MTAKDIMLALLEGKKVGFSDRRYWYLNIAGELQASKDLFMIPTEIGMLFDLRGARIISEDGP